MKKVTHCCTLNVDSSRSYSRRLATRLPYEILVILKLSVIGLYMELLIS